MNLANYLELILPAAVFVVGAASGWAKWRQGHPSRAELRAARAHARDFAATDEAHLSESVEVWAARTRLQPTRLPTPRKELP